MVLQNRDSALKQVYKKHLANLQQFFPIKTAKGLLEIGEDNRAKTGNEDYPEIILKNEKYVNGEFVQMEGKFPFQVKPEYIRGQIDVSVNTNFNAPTLRQLKRQNLTDFVKFVSELTMAIQTNPALQESIKTEDIIKQAAMDFDIDLGSIGGFKDDASHQAEELLSKIRQMVGAEGEQGLLKPATGTPAQEQQQAPGQKTTGQMMPNVANEISAGNLPPVSVPQTPNIQSV